MFCEKCGAKIKDDDKFCKKCGTNIIVKNTEQRRKFYWRGGGAFALAIAAGVVFMVVCLGVSLLVNSGQTANTQSNRGADELSKINKSFHETPVNDLLYDNTGFFVDEEEDSLSEPEREVSSIWFDGKEFKILEYLDKDTMLVKFAIDDYIIQMVLPRSLELEKYRLTEYGSDTYGDRKEASEHYVHGKKKSAIYVSVVKDTELEAFYQKLLNQGVLKDGYEEIHTMYNGSGFLVSDITELAFSIHDEESLLEDNQVFIYDPKEQVILGLMLASDDSKEREIFTKNLDRLVFRKEQDSDYVFRTENRPEDYDDRMKAMYQKYREILKSPTKYLSTNYQADGNEYGIHYLYDMTDDGIPEIIFLASPKCICIVGEKNAINLSGEAVYWGSKPGEFYSHCFWQGNGGWDHYEVSIDGNGNMVLNTIENNYLERNCDWQTDTFFYSYLGETITEEEYNRIVEEIDSPYIPDAILWGDEYIAGYGGFKESVKKLSDVHIEY